MKVDDVEWVCIIESNIKVMVWFFWFIVEFGLMCENGNLKVYGSGLLSLFGEIEYVIELLVV